MAYFFRPKWNKDKTAIIVNSLVAYGGVEASAFDLALKLRDIGREPLVIAIRKTGPSAERFKSEGIRVVAIPVVRYSKEKRICISVGNFLKLARLLRRERVGNILCTVHYANIIGQLAVFPACGRRVVIMERLTVENRSDRIVLLGRVISRGTHRVVCVSQFLRRNVLARYGYPEDKVLAIEDGAASDPVKERLDTLRAEIAGRFVFGTVGNLEKRKRHSLFVEALGELRARGHEGCMAIIVGGGEEEAFIRETVVRCDLADWVILAGSQPHPHDYYRLFDAFVFSSVLEGFGIAWAEAMRHGVPVIATGIPPMSDYIKDRVNGLLFEADSVQSLADAMEALLLNPELRRRLGDCAGEYAEQNLNRNRQLEKLIATLTEE